MALVGVGVSVIVSLATPGDLNLIDRDMNEALVYIAVAAFVFGDAIIPLLPGETVVNAAAVLASEGNLEIGWVVVAACVGAVVGDNVLYWIARTASVRFQPQIERAEADRRVQTVLRIVGERAPLFIVLGRYVPGVRFFVNASMGIRKYPYPRFLLWSTIGGVIWGTYTALLAYWVGNALSGYPIASFFISGAITTLIIVVVFWLERRRMTEAEEAPAASKLPAS
jgi:membrane protein DedA with SNARE-associated domain